jgi:Helicase C-terminal domain/Type III restriction enzyme, res subunit
LASVVRVGDMPGAIDYEELLRELGSPQFRNLRAAQAETLRLYGSGYTAERDIAIELPTGAGKSLIALLVAEAWRRDGSRKTAILTGNKTLARQMEQEANALRIRAVRMEGPGRSIPTSHKRNFQRGNTVAIMNYWVYFNQTPVIDPADLLIMDDAHLAEHCLHSLYSVEIDRFKHAPLFETLAGELANRFPHYAVLQDALDPDSPPTAPTELLSFLDQNLAANRMREILDASDCLRTDTDLRFRWHRVRSRIEESNLYVSHRSLWLRPYVYPLIRNEHYYSPHQCIYMSATIGDTSDLARRLGTRPIRKIPIPERYAVTTYGRRMLIINKIEDEDIPRRLAHAILTALRIHPKSVWLCASTADAERYRVAVEGWLRANGFAEHPMWTLTSLGSEIDEFKRAPVGHLFVGGRFDGMDFKADECRLVVLATLPKAINTQEEFLTAYLRDAGFMLGRLNQRIIQALGRCNRADDDFGVYVLADRRFATHFGRESSRRGLPQNICAEIDSAEDATELPIEELENKVRSFLSRDFRDFDQDLTEHRAAARTTPELGAERSGTSSDEVSGWAAMFDSQDYRTAQQHFARCSQAVSTPDLREVGAFLKWCQAKATFLLGRQGDARAQEESLELLNEAIRQGGISSWFNRLRSSLNQYSSASGRPGSAPAPEYQQALLHVWDDCLERLGARGTRFERWGDGIRRRLSSTSHDEYCEGLQELGRALGYSSSRPRHGAATDCRWRGVFGNTRELVTFDAKIEQISGRSIAARDVGQAHNQLARARQEYGDRGFIIRSTLVTHLEDLDKPAGSSLGEIRIVRKRTILQLWDQVFTILSQYRDDWSLDDVQARRHGADAVLTRVPADGWLTRALAGNGPFISEREILSEWR